MQKVKKQMDFFLKKTIVKFASRSKKFANLAANNNICIVLENERSIKKTFRQNQGSLIKNMSIFGTDWESTVNNFGSGKKVEQTCVR